MGKIGKPQRSNKHKKLKSVGGVSRSKGGSRRDEGLNQRPKSFTQEIPKKLRDLGMAIKDVKDGHVGKKSRNKYLKKPDAPKKNDNFNLQQNLSKTKKEKDENTNSKSQDFTFEWGKKKMGKRKQQLTKEAFEDYIDNLKPTRTLVESFSFKRRKDESKQEFMRRVDDETDRVIKKSAVDDHFDISDKRKIEMLIKKKKSGSSVEKKEKLSRKKRKAEARKEKKYDEFSDLQDKVEFGDVVHAPPTLTVLPKKAVAVGHDRPGLRIPELKEAFVANSPDAYDGTESGKGPAKSIVRETGKTVKRKSMSVFEQKKSDLARENFISAYRQLKIKKARLKD